MTRRAGQSGAWRAVVVHLLESSRPNPILAVNPDKLKRRRRLVARRAEEIIIVMQGEQSRPAVETPEGEAGQPGAAAEESAAAPGPGESEAGGEELSLEEALAAAEQDLAKHRDAMLRMQAEMENLRKRLLRDVERSRKFALERIMKDLLEVRDSMERGLEAADDSATVESLREGQQLTLRMLAKVMEDHDLELIDPQGQPFDPELHEAMTVMPSAEAEEGTVIEVLQKGFRLHDRLIRPARVVVSRKP
jgi:molecular chaperone GrpE